MKSVVVIHFNSSSSGTSFLLLWMVLLLAVFPLASSVQVVPDSDGCAGGTCPFPTTMTSADATNSDDINDDGDDNSSSSKNKENEVECGLWMGPSPIRQAEDHGFGLGIFTGKVS